MLCSEIPLARDRGFHLKGGSWTRYVFTGWSEIQDVWWFKLDEKAVCREMIPCYP